MCKKCILCNRINYGGAKFQSLHKHKKSDFICRECSDILSHKGKE